MTREFFASETTSLASKTQDTTLKSQSEKTNLLKNFKQ